MAGTTLIVHAARPTQGKPHAGATIATPHTLLDHKDGLGDRLEQSVVLQHGGTARVENAFHLRRGHLRAFCGRLGKRVIGARFKNVEHLVAQGLRQGQPLAGTLLLVLGVQVSQCREQGSLLVVASLG